MAIEQNIKQARFVSVCTFSLPWTDVDFIITTRRSYPFFSVVTRNISQYSYPHRAIYCPGGATAKTQASSSQNSSASSSPELVELNGPSSWSSSVEERRVYARWVRLGQEFWPGWKQGCPKSVGRHRENNEWEIRYEEIHRQLKTVKTVRHSLDHLSYIMWKTTNCCWFNWIKRRSITVIVINSASTGRIFFHMFSVAKRVSGLLQLCKVSSLTFSPTQCDPNSLMLNFVRLRFRIFVFFFNSANSVTFP